MERDEALPSRKPRIEHYQQEDLFLYAADREQWIKTCLAPGQRLEALSSLAQELESTVAERYETPPLVVATSSQVYYPITEQRGGLIYVSTTRRLPLDGDAELFGVHEIEGQLYGFAVYPKRDQEELVAYLRRSEPAVRTRAGIHVPLWSVPVSDSDIQLAETLRQNEEDELVRRLGGWVLSLENPAARDAANVILRGFLRDIRDRRLPAAEVLLRVENCISELRRVEQGGAVLEQVFDLAAFRLNFHKGVALSVRSHRIMSSTETVRGYTPAGAHAFSDVIPQFTLMGESLRPIVGLTFHDETNVIQVGLHDVERLIHRPDY